ncbi:MAG: TIGR03086 family metal-binding protein [Acidimicrobiales bacterium]
MDDITAYLPDAAVVQRAQDGTMPDRTDATAPNMSRAELLMTLGRDREAVAAAITQHSHVKQQGAPMDGAQQLDELMPVLHGLVDGISPEQIDRRTPCTNFTVGGVLEHMIGGATAFAPLFRGEGQPASPGTTAPTGTLQDRWRAAMADLLDAVHSDGAAERIIAAPFGEVPGSVFARFVAFDGLVHGWDLATATGQRYTPRDELVREVDAFARQALAPGMRDGDTFAAETEVPAAASVLEQLVAFSGRHVTNGKATQ